MIRNSLYLGALALAILAACTSASLSPSATATAMTSSPSPGADVSIVGTWNCGPPDEPEPGREVLEISADGTVTAPQPQGDPLSLTWTVEGDRVSFQGPPGEAPDMATIESEDRMVFDDDSAFLPGFVCTRGD